MLADPASPLPILRRIVRGLRTAAAVDREVHETPGFTVYLARESDAPELSLAVPSDDERTTDEAVRDMVRTFTERGRRARVEFIHELHPNLERTLARGGFTAGTSATVMVLARSRLLRAPPAVGRYAPLTAADRPRVEAALRGAHLAFGGVDDAGALTWMSRLVRGLADGSIVAGAVDEAGRCVAGASVIVGGDVGELAGVWSLPGHRRRGFATQACHAVLGEFFARGFEVAWLSASEEASRLYAKLGFEPVGSYRDLRHEAGATAGDAAHA